MVETFYASEALRDMREFAASMRVVAPRTSTICTWLAGHIDAAPKFRLPDCGELLGDARDTYYSAFAEMAKPPFPVQVIEFQFLSARGAPSPGLQHLSSRRLAVLFDLSGSALRAEVMDMFRGHATVYAGRPMEEGVLVIPIDYCDDAKENSGRSAERQQSWAPNHSGVVIHCGPADQPTKYGPPLGGLGLCARVELGEVGVKALSMLTAKTGGTPEYMAGAECAAEILGAISLGAALSCRNVRYSPAPAPEKLNKKRAARGAPKLHDYLAIEVDTKVDILRGGRGGDEAFGRSPKSHLRRGHIRRLADRRTWVNSTIVNAHKAPATKAAYRLK